MEDVSEDGGGDHGMEDMSKKEQNQEEAMEQTTKMMAKTAMDSATMNEEEEEGTELPPEIKARLEQLRELDNDRNEIMESYLKERAELEQKYSSLCKPLYDKRAEIVNDDEKGIPMFWVQTMQQMPVMGIVANSDVDCLKHLTDVQCRDFEDGGGFELSFHFEPNEYFTNDVLTKRYEVPNLLTADEPILKNVVGCKIEWKAPGKALTFRQVTKKQRINSGPNKGKVRTVQKRERQESFFHFFEPPRMPSMKDMDEQQANKLEEAFEQDYDVAQAFRSHIIPKAVLWFTGEALMSDMEYMMNDQSWPEGSDPFPPPASGDENPECKQN